MACIYILTLYDFDVINDVILCRILRKYLKSWVFFAWKWPIYGFYIFLSKGIHFLRFYWTYCWQTRCILFLWFYGVKYQYKYSVILFLWNFAKIWYCKIAPFLHFLAYVYHYLLFFLRKTCPRDDCSPKSISGEVGNKRQITYFFREKTEVHDTAWRNMHFIFVLY